MSELLMSIKQAYRYEQDIRWWGLCMAAGVAALTISIAGLFVFWMFEDVVPVTYTNEPFPVAFEGDGYRIVRSYNAMSDAPYTTVIEYQDLSKAVIATADLGKLKHPEVGVFIEDRRSDFLLFPSVLQSGNTYRVKINECYIVNPLFTRCESHYTEWWVMP